MDIRRDGNVAPPRTGSAPLVTTPGKYPGPQRANPMAPRFQAMGRGGQGNMGTGRGGQGPRLGFADSRGGATGLFGERRLAGASGANSWLEQRSAAISSPTGAENGASAWGEGSGGEAQAATEGAVNGSQSPGDSMAKVAPDGDKASGDGGEAVGGSKVLSGVDPVEGKPAAALDEAEEFPEDRIYSRKVFARFSDTRAIPPEPILNFALKAWNTLGDAFRRPDHLSTRATMMGVNATTPPLRIRRQRRLHNEVMGILARVTPEKLEELKAELVALPIRQSTDEEINEVIQTFFKKSIRPEDALYTRLYVYLLVHLLDSMGDSEVRNRIQLAIVEQCKVTFLNANEKREALDDEIANLPDDEKEQRRMMFAAQQKANVAFLGLLFVHSLVLEAVVVNVLYSLLYGKRTNGHHRRRVPAEHDVVNFVQLLLVSGKHFSEEVCTQYLKQFIETMTELSQNHPQKRIKFLLMDTLDTIANNWVPVHGVGMGPMKLQELKEAQELQQQKRDDALRGASSFRGGSYHGQGGGGSGGGGGGGGSHFGGDGAHSREVPSRVVATPPPPPPPPAVPTQQEFTTAMDSFFKTSSVDESVKVFSNTPKPVLLAYISKWLGRYITTTRYSNERGRLGELFEKLIHKTSLTAEDAREALHIHLLHAIQEDLFPDQPRYFANWAAVIRSGYDIFPMSLHTKFLRTLVDNGSSLNNIVRMVTDVSNAISESSTDATEPTQRFRVLQMLLRYSPNLREQNPDAEDEDELTILERVKDFEVEVDFFLSLCADEPREITVKTTGLTNRQPLLATPIISALFTYLRFDVEARTALYKDSLKKILSVREVSQLLVEVYATWQSLDRQPSNAFFAFIREVKQIMGIKAEQAEKLRRLISKRCVVDDDLPRLDAALK